MVQNGYRFMSRDDKVECSVCSNVCNTGDLDANRPVPFRLTPNILEYLSAIGIGGPLTASMIAAARCLVQPSFKVQTILRAILRDEMIAGHRKVRTQTVVPSSVVIVAHVWFKSSHRSCFSSTGSICVSPSFLLF
jgi:phosphatidylinositol kinase/protein kinase (PI-3  family)